MARIRKSRAAPATGAGVEAPSGAQGARIELYGGRERGVILRQADPDTGLTVTHVRRLDFLDDWLEKGRITRDEYYVAQDFRANLRIAGCGERYKTIFDITNTNSRGGTVNTDPLSGDADARRYVQASMDVLGASTGDAIWHIVGLEWSLNHYSQQKRLAGRVLNRDIAAGMVQSGLEVLARLHARGERKKTD